MKHFKKRTLLLLLLSFVFINVNAWYIRYRGINDYTEFEVYCIEFEHQEWEFDVKTVEIPSFHQGYPVTRIGDNVFDGFRSLESITLPSTLRSIGTRAFCGCKSLTSVTIPNSVTGIGVEAFRNCTALTEITIPNSVKGIGQLAFYLCTSLTSVNILNSETSIGDGAFEGCTSLTYVTIPNSVGADAFKDCTSLTSVTIGNSVGKIGSGAFWDCPLESIVFGSGHYEVGIDAFHGRSNDCTVHIPDLSYWLQITFEDINANPLYGLNNKLFVNGKEIISEALVIENTNIVKPYTLAGQDKITSVVFSSDVEEIRTEAFLDCKNLESITLSNGVRSIWLRAFSGTKLRSVTIPASIEYLGKYALGSRVLDYVVILKDTPPRTDPGGADTNDPFNTTVLYVPVGSYEKYKKTLPWKLYNIIEGVPNSIEIVEEGHAEELGRYLLDGTRVEEPQNGLNIIRYSDGSTKKVMVK